jgi:predicted Ser/Thr protein kinase
MNKAQGTNIIDNYIIFVMLWIQIDPVDDMGFLLVCIK